MIHGNTLQGCKWYKRKKKANRHIKSSVKKLGRMMEWHSLSEFYTASYEHKLRKLHWAHGLFLLVLQKERALFVGNDNSKQSTMESSIHEGKVDGLPSTIIITMGNMIIMFYLMVDRRPSRCNACLLAVLTNDNMSVSEAFLKYWKFILTPEWAQSISYKAKYPSVALRASYSWNETHANAHTSFPFSASKARRSS